MDTLNLQQFCYGTEILNIEDGYGPLQVFEDGDERFMMFGSIYEQSCHKISDPAYLVHHYTRAMLLAMLLHPARHVTLLGLGGGSLGNCLYRYFPEVQIQAVELREMVIATAYSHFQLPRDARLSVAHQEAGAYLRQAAAASTDIIFCDLFHAHEIDGQQLQIDFLTQCHRVLRDGGWLTLNYFDCHRIFRGNFQLLHGLFNQVLSCQLQSGNWVILAGKQSAEFAKEKLREQARQQENRLGFPLLPYVDKLEFMGNDCDGN